MDILHKNLNWSLGILTYQQSHEAEKYALSGSQSHALNYPRPTLLLYISYRAPKDI